ncbi:MAG: nucleotide exchange factor GrpE [Proteobacteria bacterium]|nr:nucleotide exchange factor GrpE [Pseudomonadota bacterium]
MTDKGKKSQDKHPKSPDAGPSQRYEDDNLLASRVVSADAGLPSPEHVEELRRQIESLNATIQAEQEKVAAYWDRLLRKEADLQNLQKRMQEEVEKTRKFAIDKFALELLEVQDSLEHGLNFAKNGQVEAQHLLEGMNMTHRILMNALEKQGIQIINPEGEAFNPAFHEAISVQETNDVPPNQVLAVVQKGYTLNNRLLRPARVVVSRAPAS